MPGRPIAISEAESVVMEALWRDSPRTADEVVAAVAHEHHWQPVTVKTLLSRLLAKGAIRAKKDGRRYLYWPTLQRQKWLAAESTHLIDRLFGGRVGPLVAHFSQERKLSKRDIAEIKRLLQDLEDGASE